MECARRASDRRTTHDRYRIHLHHQAGRARQGHSRGRGEDREIPRPYMRQEIVTRQVKAMREAGLDAMISCSPENFAYLAGFVVPSQPLIRHRHAMAIIMADKNAALFGVD